MARPQADAHVCYYPATDGLIKLAAAQLRVDCDPKLISLLDPCIGDGMAVKRLADALGIPYENIRAAELTKNRGEDARQLLPGAEVLSPCCFLSGCNRPERAFTFVYCNPPYNAEVGGGYRVETQFLEKIGFMVPIGGVLLMVVPWNTTTTHYFKEELGKKWRRVRVIRVPAEDAPYNETIIVAYRANNKPVWGDETYGSYAVNYESKELTASQLDADDKADALVENKEEYGSPFIIPAAKKLCADFHKTALTKEEIIDRLLNSPIEREVCTPPPIDRGRPPLALTTGHNGILVASGQAPPVVTLRDDQGRMLEVPHLIRGVARKEAYVKSINEELDDDDETIKVKKVISEAVDLKMTVLLHTGELINLNEQRDATPIEKPQDGGVVLPPEQGKVGHGGFAI